MAKAKVYLGKTGTVLFSVAVAIFALLNAISTFTKYAPLSAIYLSRDLGYVWTAQCVICILSAAIIFKQNLKGRFELLIWYHYTCIEFALFTIGVLLAYIIIGYRKHQTPQPGPYILYGVGLLLQIILIRHTWIYRWDKHVVGQAMV